MSIKYILLMVLCGASAGMCTAQKKDTLTSTPGALFILKTYQPWLCTNNAAGMAVHPVTSVGKTDAGTLFESGGFRRPQQPESSKQLYFQSERYETMKNSVLYGSFKFIRQWDNKLRLTDVADPYRGNPYIIADSLVGDWQKQIYELNLKAATFKTAKNKLNIGLGIDYKAASGSRQNDPRPLNTIHEAALTPSLVWNLNLKNHIGINGRYGSYKEEADLKVNTIGVAQNIYKLTGPGMYIRDIIPGLTNYVRNYKGNNYGGDIQYEYATEGLKCLISGGIQWRSEDVTDGSTVLRAAGKLYETRYNIQTSVLYQPSALIHSLRFNWEQYDRSGREYFQDFNSGVKYETIFSTILTTSLTTTSQLTYELIAPANEHDYKWILSAGLGFSGLDNMYLYPRSRQIADRAHYMLGARRNWIGNSGNNLAISVNAACTGIINAKSQLAASGTNYISRQLFYPDQGYLSSASFRGAITIEYAFTVPSVIHTRFYIKGNGTLVQHTGKEQYGVSGTRQQVGLSLGAIY